MLEQNEIYKCPLCGNVISAQEANGPIPVCCGQTMKKMPEITVKEEGTEKHKPVVSIKGDKVIVNVGSIDHPMDEDHWIEFIQILKDGKVIAEKKLYPGDKPRAEFLVEDSNNIRSRAYCNMHGLWTND
ncbi:desulfoferrodoxin [archaeon]|nr:desulfoferrodoxin [archaeon]MBL7056865.1 desulfoferrodoxin [Candidatus Woesearchaeota archaeon]